jgi:Na+-driven multidrug efflux pump
MRSLGMLTFTIPCGFSTACGILVGRSFGRGCVTSLKRYYSHCMYISLAVAFLQVVVLLLLQNQIISIFTDIESVAIHIRQAWFVFNIFVIVDTTQGVAVSVLRASGQ